MASFQVRPRNSAVPEDPLLCGHRVFPASSDQIPGWKALTKRLPSKLGRVNSAHVVFLFIYFSLTTPPPFFSPLGPHSWVFVSAWYFRNFGRGRLWVGPAGSWGAGKSVVICRVRGRACSFQPWQPDCRHEVGACPCLGIPAARGLLFPAPPATFLVGDPLQDFWSFLLILGPHLLVLSSGYNMACRDCARQVCPAHCAAWPSCSSCYGVLPFIWNAPTA